MLHSVDVDHDDDVFVFFLGEKAGITMKLTPEEAIRIGEIGEMARLRKLVAEYQEKEELENGRERASGEDADSVPGG